MTELLSQAMDRVNRLPKEAQDDVARALLQLLDLEISDDVIELSDREAVDEASTYLDRGEFADDEAIKAAWRRFGP